MSNAREGEEVAFVGPQRSLVLDEGPVVLVGGETSVAVAAAFTHERRGHIRAVIQGRDAAGVHAAAEAVGLEHEDVVSPGDTAATVAAIVA